MADILIDIIADHFGVDRAQISENTDVVEEYSPDSLDIMEIIIAYEKATGKSVPNDLIADLRTPAELVGVAR